MMRVADGDGQRVGRVGALEVGGGQQGLDHQLHLALFGMAGADDGFLDQVGGIFADRQPAQSRRHQRHAARLPELQRRARAGGDEGLLDRRLVGRVVRRCTPPRPRCSAASRSASDPSTGGVMVPQATKLSRLPKLSMMPQPQRRSPGSIPMIRTVSSHSEALGQEPAAYQGQCERNGNMNDVDERVVA